jgi:soluble lytic murein transglycosylase-like protein
MSRGTHRRLVALLFVAIVSGVVAGFVGNAPAGTTAVRPLPLRLVPAAAALPARDCPIPAVYRDAFEAAAADTGLPLALLVAVAKVESNFDQEALSHAGARGLLQLMPATALELRLDPDQPAQNVLAGARYLRAQLDRFRSADLALAAYNAGPTAVARAGGAIGPGNLTYVANVTRHWRSLAGCS